MARTRLRGLEIGGIQMGIEVPEHCEWDWPDAPVADYQCLPREPEVHVGVRVGSVNQAPLAGERYVIGRWTFEAARRGTDWLLGLSRNGHREQLALFDREFRTGEVVLSVGQASKRAYPLMGLLDEWIVLHRNVARGGLCLSAAAHARDGQAVIRLGARPDSSAGRWSTPSTSLLGRHTLLVREERDELRLFRMPWSESIDPTLGVEAKVAEMLYIEAAAAPFRNALDPAEAEDLLARLAVVPLADEALFDRVMRNARRIASSTRISEVGTLPQEETGPRWQSASLASAGIAPRTHAL